MSLTSIQITAAVAFDSALASGYSEIEAVRYVWKFLRRAELKNLRAPDAFEQLHVNTGCRKSYVSPIAAALDLPFADGNRVFGHHSSKYPRTGRSFSESISAQNDVLSWFRSQSKLAA